MRLALSHAEPPMRTERFRGDRDVDQGEAFTGLCCEVADFPFASFALVLAMVENTPQYPECITEDRSEEGGSNYL